MEDFLLSLVFGVIGAVFGSFSVAQVWRLRASQLQDEKSAGEKIDSAEWKKLHSLVSKKVKNDRSHCLNCGYQLKWFDLIPIVSWLSLGGKCRKCRSKIGALEFISEILIFVNVKDFNFVLLEIFKVDKLEAKSTFNSSSSKLFCKFKFDIL